jgi:pyruvate/2-oxoacid:ferredoxin oxidoreductase beta subunit
MEIHALINSVAQALALGVTRVSRGFSRENGHLAELIAGAARKGFAIVVVFMPCVT